MKKVIFAALSIAVFGTANAQSPAPYASATASTPMTMILDDVITINASQPSMTAHFKNANDYGWHEQFSGPASGPWGQNVYQVQSNRYYNVTIGIENITYSGTQGYSGNNISYEPGDVRFKLVSAGNTTAGTPAVSVGAWVPFSSFNGSQNVLNNCPNTVGAGTVADNTGKKFALEFLSTPNWKYAGGTYTTNVLVTATQE